MRTGGQAGTAAEGPAGDPPGKWSAYVPEPPGTVRDRRRPGPEPPPPLGRRRPRTGPRLRPASRLGDPPRRSLGPPPPAPREGPSPEEWHPDRPRRLHGGSGPLAGRQRN